jgi:hypothetical protein
MQQIRQQKNRELLEQKNTIPKELNSYNFAVLLDYRKTGCKHQKRPSLSRQSFLPRRDKSTSPKRAQ